MSGPTINRHRSKQDYPTPWEFIHACEKRFGKITFDLAAGADNAKAQNYYTQEIDSLSRPWHKLKGWLWLNPPFDKIKPWACKCMEEQELGAQILFLTPASVGANWFRDYVHRHAWVCALSGRIQFIGADYPYPKDCILSVFDKFRTEGGLSVWDWRNDKMQFQNTTPK